MPLPPRPAMGNAEIRRTPPVAPHPPVQRVLQLPVAALDRVLAEFDLCVRSAVSSRVPVPLPEPGAPIEELPPRWVQRTVSVGPTDSAMDALIRDEIALGGVPGDWFDWARINADAWSKASEDSEDRMGVRLMVHRVLDSVAPGSAGAVQVIFDGYDPELILHRMPLISVESTVGQLDWEEGVVA